MKIELWYDSVVQETDIVVNGISIGKNDPYGFLYPVRNYPIQSWLYPNGSWKGIEHQIVDLARDENVELSFHGRKYDYDDLEKCGDEKAVREAGRMRLEGKEYEMQDGDICHFRFNV